MTQAPRIAVIGESLIDLIRQPSGDLRPHLGGSPYNVARAIAGQGLAVCYLSPLSVDPFGRDLRQGLVDEGVALPEAEPSPRPTSLAVVSLDEGGQPSYALYREGVADRDVTAAELLARLPDDTTLLHTGSLALVPGERDKMRTVLTEARARGILVAIDVNLRPLAEPDLGAYAASVLELVALGDIVKASDEDIAALGLGTPEAGARALLERLDDGLVALTEGARGATLLRQDGALRADAWPVETVVDTVGAGDTFQAGLLAALAKGGWLAGRAFAPASLEDLRPCLDHARIAAALNVGRAGASPPSWSEVVSALQR